MSLLTEWLGWLDHPVLLLALVVLNVPTYTALGRVFFGNGDGGAREAIWYWLTPDFTSMFRGEWRDDQWAEFKILFFVVSCALAVGAEYTGISKFIALFVRPGG